MDCKKLYFAVGFSGAAMLLMGLIIFIPIPQSGQDSAKYIVGFLSGTALGTIIAYYWGTSEGSARKTELMAKGNVPPPVNPPTK